VPALASDSAPSPLPASAQPARPASGRSLIGRVYDRLK